MQAVINSTVKVEDPLPSISRQYDLRDFVRNDEKTIHTDFEAAQREGLPGPVAIGPQVAALVFRQLRQAFGPGWIEGGRCGLTFRRQIPVDAFCTAHGRVTGVEHHDGLVKVTCEVWVEDGEGERVIVGEASAAVPQ